MKVEDHRKILMNKASILKRLITYFNEKGEVYNLTDYKKQEDHPIKYSVVIRLWGSWARVALAANRYVDDNVKKFKIVRK